jgi:hypothetical protein
VTSADYAVLPFSKNRRDLQKFLGPRQNSRFLRSKLGLKEQKITCFGFQGEPSLVLI